MSDYISNESINELFVERFNYTYNDDEKDIMNLSKEIIINEIKILKKKGITIIYENQDIIATKIVNTFKNKKIINIMVIAKTQSGKTGSMCATIKKYLEESDNLIPIENIYIITGLSSCEWKEQTKERMPESIQKRVFHRNDLNDTFIDEIKNKKNIIIIMDEIQVAAKKDQTIYNTFKKAGLLDKSKLYENDIKILEYTATPDGTIYDLMKWNEASSKILANVGNNYKSSYNLLTEGRVKQYKDLCGYDNDSGEINQEVFKNIKEIKEDIDNYNQPLYHIIRTKNGKEQDITINNFKKIFKVNEYEFVKYDRESEIDDINKTLIMKPKKHTFIFIKEMLRCAKTLKKNFIGILYDRYSLNPDDTAIIQGLVGRNTGYDTNNISICYTNKESIIKYEKLWESEFEDKTIDWNSKTTTFVKGILSGKNTFNDPKDYDGFSVSSDDSDELDEPIINKFKTYEEVKDYWTKILKCKKEGGTGPKKKTPNKDGYYEATIRGKKKVYTSEEMYNERKCNIKNGAGYGFRACYRNINDKNTLEFWLIHY